MPEKSIREMNRFERQHYSLAARVFHSTVISSILLGLVAFAVGLGLYTYALVGQYIGESFGLARSTTLVVNAVVDVEDVAGEVMEIYRGLSDADRKNGNRSEAYRALYSHVMAMEGYETLRNIFYEFTKASNVDDLYLAMYDNESSTMVYIVDPDPDPESWCAPGDFDEVNRKGMEHFLNWNGEGKLYDIDHTDRYGWMCTAGVPIRNKAGEIVAFVLADVTLEEVAKGMKSFTWQYTLAMALATFALGYFLTRHMKKTLVAPINAIADAAQKYIDDKNNNVSGGAHFSALDIHTGDEIENLSLLLADMETDLTEYVTDLTQVTAEKERIRTELNLATSIQANMLPNTFPAFPEHDEFDIFATMNPAKEVGGDFYDFFMIDDDRLALVMGDVSGKGVPAALFMMTARTMLKDALLARLDPAQALWRVNGALSENNKDMMFVTVWLGVLEISKGKLVWADAGHERPMLCRNGVWSFLEKHNGLPLAVMEPEYLDENDPPFINQELEVRSGDILFQYTDGVTEAMTVEREQFGNERLMEAVRSSPSDDPQVLLPHIRAQIDAFVKEADQFDDITMLGLKIHASK